MRRLTGFGLVGLALALPTAAQAKLIEPPGADLGHVATCVRATGVPDELLTTGTWGAHGGVRLYRATPAGPVGGERIPVAFQATCASVASDPQGGTAVAVAGANGAGKDAERHVLVAVRPPGGRFGAPVVLASTSRGISQPAVAIDARGDAIVAWLETGFRATDFGETVRVARILAGGRPTAPQTLQRTRMPLIGSGSGVAVALDRHGEATAAWVGPSRHGTSPVLVSHGPVTARVGTPQEIPALAAGSGPRLAVAANGRTLLAVAGISRLTIAERAPGATVFARVQRIDATGLADTGPPAVGDDGAAILTYRACCDDAAPLYATVRSVAGATFSAPRRLGGRERNGSSDSTVSDDEPPVRDDDTAGHPALVGDGRAAVAFVAAARDGRPVARLATGTVTAGLGRARGYGSPVLGAEGAVPFTTADGGVGLAWTEDFARGGADDPPVGPGRLRVALPAASPAPAALPPAVAIRVAPRLLLRRDGGIPVDVRCRAACDMRVGARGRALSRALPGGRWTRLIVPPGSGGFGTPSGRRVQLLARASMPSASTATSATATTVVVRRPPRPLPAVRHLSAHRVGARIVVSWRTDIPVRRAVFFAVASLTRDLDSAVAGRDLPGAGGTRFRLVLGPDQRFPFSRGRARWVRLYTLAPDRLSAGHARLVPVR
jgi:hypothetical protein